jgi:hypothetical protein
MLNDVFLAAEGLISDDNPDYPYAVTEGESCVELRRRV